MKKGIIFDVDGTLWDASAQVVDSWNEVLSMHPGLDVSITVEDMNNNMGKTMDELGRAFFPSFSHEERTRFMKECMEYENRYLETHCAPLYHHPYIVALGQACIAKALPILYIFPKAAGFKKHFNVSALAVAYNEQFIVPGQPDDRLLYPWIQ